MPPNLQGFPGGLEVKNLLAIAGAVGGTGSIPGLGMSLWRRKPTPGFLPENSMDRVVWWATVHGVSKTQTQLRMHTSMFTQISMSRKLFWGEEVKGAIRVDK